MSEEADAPGLFELGGSFFLIAGPCVLEDRELNLHIARHVRKVGERLGIPVVFKASFDKANRTKLGSDRGPGLERGLDMLREIRAREGVPVLTDIHEAAQAEEAALGVDALQIPAFLCRQTDLLLAAAATGLPVNVKKGQWVAPAEMRHAVAKLRAGGATRVAVTERGSAFGYGRWVVDMRSFAIMRQACGCPTIFDATHAVQLPGAGAGGSRAEPRFIEPLARAAVAAGADGLFAEVHPDPPAAPCDGASMLRLERLEPLLAGLLEIRRALA
ncbi:MAG: 3-deoxy-8-phosphooctulonate synthase [Gemmatimonadota bacterium]